MSLELNKLTWQVGQMGRVMSQRQQDHERRVRQARETLQANAEVTLELREKIAAARQSDESWRGAEPLGPRLDERHVPANGRQPATLIAVDGSQVYPNRHDIAPYFLINVGSIVMRQGSGQAPLIDTRPTIYFEDDDLYDDAGHLCRPEQVNAERSKQELDSLVALAEAERAALGGDLGPPILALTDGPLLPWQSARRRTQASEIEKDPQLSHFVAQMERLCQLHVVPIGYVDRPNSANLLRTLELTRMDTARIDRRAVRHGDFRLLMDRLLMGDLGPNERSGLFVSTSELNERLKRAGSAVGDGGGGGYQVGFFYLNVARPDSSGQPMRPAIARVDLPAWEWLIGDAALMDVVQHALYSDAELTRYPYTLARAHELAVIGTFERANLEAMLQRSMWTSGLVPLTSEKEAAKRATGRKRRR